jgi:hypothetical protein
MPAEPKTVAEVIDAVANGRIGHREAMQKLHLESYGELIETMHANGRRLWAHKPTKPDPKTLDILARACGRRP